MPICTSIPRIQWQSPALCNRRTCSRGARLRGIHVLGTGDALQPEWQKGWEPYLENDAGIVIVPQGEIEDQTRVHHVILAEDLGQFSQLRDLMKGKCKSFESSGRPHIYLSGEEIAAFVHEVGAFIGPAHAFTPWTSMFAYFDSVQACYGSERIDFLELGLSADRCPMVQELQTWIVSRSLPTPMPTAPTRTDSAASSTAYGSMLVQQRT